MTNSLAVKPPLVQPGSPGGVVATELKSPCGDNVVTAYNLKWSDLHGTLATSGGIGVVDYNLKSC